MSASGTPYSNGSGKSKRNSELYVQAGQPETLSIQLLAANQRIALLTELLAAKDDIIVQLAVRVGGEVEASAALPTDA